MIAVWIVAISFITVGLIYSIPKYYKIFSCRAKTTGTLLRSQKSLTSDNKAIKATYDPGNNLLMPNINHQHMSL